MANAESSHERQRGQLLVIFASEPHGAHRRSPGSRVDAGSTFAQQRSQQTASDLAALAAANDYLINGNTTLATTRARTVAAANGFTHAVDSTVVAVTMGTSGGFTARVVISSPHRNVMASRPRHAHLGGDDRGHGGRRVPRLRPRRRRRSSSRPMRSTPTGRRCTRRRPTSARRTATSRRAASTSPGRTTGRATWTRPRSPRSSRAPGSSTRSSSSGSTSASTTTATTAPCSPTWTRTSAAATCRWRSSIPAATSQGGRRSTSPAPSGGTDKHVRGYFLSSFESAALDVNACVANDCPRYLGSYVLKLID